MSPTYAGEDAAFIAYESRSKLLRGLFGSIAFVALGADLLSFHDIWSVIVGALGIVFFGFCSVVIAWRLLRPRHVVLDFNDHGFFDRRQMDAPIPWSAVQRASVVAILRTRYIDVQLDREDRMPRRTRRSLSTALGYGACNIGTGYLDHSPDAVIEAFFSRLERMRSHDPA